MPAIQPDASVWTDNELLECCSVVPEAPNTATISFVAPSGASFRYLPGQFVTLELPLPHGPEWRTYTLSSSPSRPLGVSITVKAQQNSLATRWMLDNLKPGTQLRAKGPSGSFAISRDAREKYLFISAGSGVTSIRLDDDLSVRSRNRHRRRSRKLRPKTVRAYLSPGARIDGGARAVDQAPLHRRGGGSL